jgi:hypothetical protein
MPEPRWITPDELKELIRRALRCLDGAGYVYEGTPKAITGQAVLGHVKVTLTANGDVVIGDYVANVLTFDYETHGIRECYGSTARNALIFLRQNMVLEDLADV